MLDDSQLARARALFPRLTDPAQALAALLDAEEHRRGARDLVSGAYHALALNQGALLKEDFDLGSHYAGWVMGAAVVDIRELTVVNMKLGFEAGDAALRHTATALQATCPEAKVVRIHSDAFAVLLGPAATQRVSPGLADALREALQRGAPHPLEFSIGLLKLTVVAPSHWQVLGPLVWAECERAVVLARRAPNPGVLERTLVLEAGLPEEALSGR